jgi:hypothetical protein
MILSGQVRAILAYPSALFSSLSSTLMSSLPTSPAQTASSFEDADTLNPTSGPFASGPFSVEPFAGRRVRMELVEMQKAELGRRYVIPLTRGPHVSSF